MEDRDVPVMKGIGKTGMAIGGASLAAAGVELGRSAKDLYDIKDDISGIGKLRKNKHLRAIVKDEIEKNLPRPVSDRVIEKVKWADSHFPKINKIDKAQKIANIWNTGAKKVSRTVLDNAEYYTDMATKKVKERLGDNINKLTEAERQALDRIPRTVGKAGKSITHFKNARILGKTGATIGAAAGALYVNGRNIESRGGSSSESKKD